MCNVIRRSHRRGFKAGALDLASQEEGRRPHHRLRLGLRPAPDYLERVVPHFFNPDGSMVADLAMVQARWGFQTTTMVS